MQGSRPQAFAAFVLLTRCELHSVYKSMLRKVAKLTGLGGLISTGFIVNTSNDKVEECATENRNPHVNKYKTRAGELVLSHAELITPSNKRWQEEVDKANKRAEELCWNEINQSG